MSGEGTAADRTPQRGRALVAVFLLATVAILGVAEWLRHGGGGKGNSAALVPAAASSESGPIDTSAYVGDRACAECHPGEFAAHQGSGHSHTLTQGGRSPWAARLDGRSLRDPEQPEINWTIKGGKGTFEITRTEGDKVDRTPIEYVFGSGKHGLSFLTTEPAKSSTSDLQSIENHISYYAPGDRLDITTGQDKTSDAMAKPGKTVMTKFGRVLEEGTTRRCFDCHATLTSSRGYNHFDTQSLIANVGCERCHGPARDHVASARRRETPVPLAFGYESVGVDAEVRLCGKCHRYLKEMVPLSLNPGNLSIVRFQPVGLMMSRCYSSALSGLRCSTCHDPHARPSTDVASYESKCIGCHHQGAKQRLCSLKPTPSDGCIGCHMPKRKVPEGFVFTDHWIRRPNEARRPDTLLPAPATREDVETVPPGAK